MTSSLQGKVVLITGASKGIGKAIASIFANEGARLALCARDEQQLTRTTEEIQIHTKADIIAIKANMTKLNDIRRFVDAALKKFNRIDVLINNAGGTHIGGIANTSDEEWEYHLQLKLLGYIRMAREVIPHMKTSGGGRIINIVGMAAREPTPLYMVSGITDAALLNFTKSLSKELEATNITVNAINPTTTETPLAEETFKMLAEHFHTTPDEFRQSVINSLPQHRLATPDDIANVALFLASDAASFVNGISINVDAGRASGLW